MDKDHERQSTETGTSDHIKELEDYLEEPVEKKKKLAHYNIGVVI